MPEELKDNLKEESEIKKADVAEEVVAEESEGKEFSVPSAAEAAEMQTADIGKRKKKNRWGFILTVVIFAFVVWALWSLGSTLQNGNTATLQQLISGMNGWYLLAAFALTLAVWLCDTLKYSLLNSTFNCKIGFWRDMKLGLTGKYYECITPTGTGGQPMQIYYMHKNGVGGGKSTSVVMVKYASQMFAAAVIGAIVMIAWGKLLYNVIDNGTIVNGIFFAGWIGFVINAFAPIFVVFVIFCPNFLKWVINLGLTLLHKMHIIKKLDERRAKIYRGIDDFSVCSQFIFKHPIKFLQLFLLCMVEPICGCIIPYFVIMALCGGRVTGVSNLLFTIAAISTFSTYASSFIPTPGTSGAAESVFMLAFSALIGNAVFWVTLIWRFYLYYIYIVLGIGMNLYDLTVKIVRDRRQKRNASVVEQSIEEEEE